MAVENQNQQTQVQKSAPMNPLKALDQQMGAAKTAKDVLQIPFVKDRYVKNFEAISGLKNGEQQFEVEAFHFMELANQKPELMKADGFSIVAGFMRAAAYGASFQGNDLSVFVRSGKLVVDLQAHGKRRLLEKIGNIKEVGIAVLIFKGDKIKYNPKTKRITDHEQQWTTEATPETVDGAYSTIYYTDGTERDVLINQSEIKKARAKSQMQDGGTLWKDHYGEAVKKTVYNRAFKELWRKPAAAELYTQFEYKDAEIIPSGTDQQQEDESPDPTVIDQTHTQETIPNNEETRTDVDHETGEEIKEPAKTEEKKQTRRGSGEQKSFI